MKASSTMFCSLAAVVLAFGLAAPVVEAQIDDIAILNFALNLEYLEAEFYSKAVFGSGLSADLRGGGPPSIGGSKVPLSYENEGIAEEIATDEVDHVKFLRLVLGDSAVPMPQLDVGPAFAAAADAALNTTLSPPFSPYRESGHDLLFLHGAFIFEDVGVTAYAGAANLISSKNVLQYAARILAVEAMHAGTIRTQLWRKANMVVKPYGAKVSTIIAAISDLRAAVGGANTDQGLLRKGRANIVPTNGNGLVPKRSTDQITAIVTLGGAGNKGGFFPNGLNGVIA